MARLPRFVIPGQPQHVILRGNNRTETFCTDSDYQFYLEKLLLACKTHDCDLHAYVLMTNHVHLLITPHAEQSLAKAMQMVGVTMSSILTTVISVPAHSGKGATRRP